MKNAKKVLSPVLAGILLLTMLFTGVTLLSTTAEEEYKPTRSITVSTETNINPTFFLETGSSLFKDGETYTLTGKVKINLTGEITGTSNTMNAGYGGRYQGTTNGWISIVDKTGKPYTFKGKTG